jgi:hypothetical protein
MATQYANGKIVTSGLVLALDAADRNSYVSGSTTWNDVSGNGNNGTLTNGPTYSNINNGSIVFDGVDDYISFNSLTTALLGLTSSNGATIGCWLKLNILSRWTGVVNFFSSPNQVSFGWDIDPTNALRVWKNSVGSYTTSIASYSNIWTYYVIVSNSSNTIVYINANETATVTASGNIVNNGNLMFGDHWDNSIQGNAANLKIYNRALSASEIAQNYNAQKSRFNL